MPFGSSGLAQTMPPRGSHVQAEVGRVSRPRRSGLFGVPLPVAVVLTTMLLPGELDFSIGPLRLNCLRLALLILAPIAAGRLLTGRGMKLRGFDLIFVAAYSYYALAMFLKEPFEKAIQSGGILFLESVGAYLIARVYIRDSSSFKATVKLLFVAVILLGLMAIPESIFFSRFVRNFAAGLTGHSAWQVGDSRIGLMRAMAVFDHPIHYGVFCAGVFGLVWFSEPNTFKRLIRATLIVIAAFFSLSAGPLQGIVLVLAGAVWERATRYIPYRVWLTVGLFVFAYLLAALVTNRGPIKILVTNLVFDSGTAWYRILIWDYGVDNVLNNPWLGTHLGSWERPAWMPNDTLDNYWLTIAIWGGLPSLILYAMSIIALLRRAHARLRTPEPRDRRRCRFAWTATVLTLCTVGATVHYWGALQVYFSFCLGLGAWLADPRRDPVPAHYANPNRRY